MRLIIALVLSIAWAGSIPVYGMPFGGCDAYGYATLELGCSTWLEFIRGFGFVLIWLVVAPTRTWLYFLVLLLLVMLSVYQDVRFNGLTLLQSADGWYLALAQGFPILLGGLVALAIYSGVRRVAHKKPTEQ